MDDKIFGPGRGRHGRVQDAVGDFPDLDSLDPEDRRVQANLGASHLQAGQRDAVIGQLERALAGDPKLVSAADLLIEALIRERDFERARAVVASLSERLGGVFDRLRGRGALNEADVREAMREVRIALLEADVALPVVRSFIDKVTEQAVGQSVLKSITPGQQVVKIVNDALVEMLGAEASERDLAGTPPAIIDRIRDAARQVAQDADFIRIMAGSGNTLDYRDGDAFKRFYDEDAGRLLRVIRALGKIE